MISKKTGYYIKKKILRIMNLCKAEKSSIDIPFNDFSHWNSFSVCAVSWHRYHGCPLAVVGHTFVDSSVCYAVYNINISGPSLWLHSWIFKFGQKAPVWCTMQIYATYSSFTSWQDSTSDVHQSVLKWSGCRHRLVLQRGFQALHLHRCFAFLRETVRPRLQSKHGIVY